MNDKLLTMFFDVLTSPRIDWKRTWIPTQGAMNLFSKKEYSGCNMYLSFVGRYFATFKQISDAGGNVKRGVKGYPIIYTLMERDVLDDGSLSVNARYKGIRYYTVFNIDDTTGLENLIEEKESEVKTSSLEDTLNSYREKEGIGLNVGEPAYSPVHDSIYLPLPQKFSSYEDYLSVYSHEAVHSTGNDKRLKRFLPKHTFGSEGYAQEELIAEIGSVMLTGNKISENSKAYIQNWIKKAAKSDDNSRRLEIFRAFTKAKSAVNFIQPTKTDGIQE